MNYYEVKSVSGWAGWYYEQTLPDENGLVEWWWEVEDEIVASGWARGGLQAEADAIAYIERNYDPPASVIG